MIDWANILTLARSRAGITQIQAAEKTGLSRNTIINFEKGRRIPRADDLELLEKAYGQTFIDLSELNPTSPRDQEEIASS
ncbi:helix-turn-helix domain-containing protein [Dethiosulfovibrio salsuginis]|uniref:Helix-turn-helix n=1 Tax=Dethiosulfovibrio salsuginis TaxID=561720 RepID=A0A1X7KI32_9BACT|nr:helix-turn-helix transcriptional regulator [Dethiosulfovibrio salsuginis]SMG40695.1 Helix-turn-helix [Dethiosulfovibrio salsuginis]